MAGPPATSQNVPRILTRIRNRHQKPLSKVDSTGPFQGRISSPDYPNPLLPPRGEGRGGGDGSDDDPGMALLGRETAGRRRPASRPQYWSAETTSPPAMVLRARQALTLIEFFTNWTWPSAISALTPPAWKLRAALYAGELAEALTH